MAILRERHLGDVVVHDGHALTGAAHRRGIPDVALDELLAGGEVVARHQVEGADLVAALAQDPSQRAAEVARAAGDQNRHSWPCSMHQRMLRRMPSSSATAGR